MDDAIDPHEAADALASVGFHQQQVIDAVGVPSWYWWALGGLMVALGISVDTRAPVAVGIGVAVFVVVVVSLTLSVATTAGRAQVRNDLLGYRGVRLILRFVAVVVGVSLITAFVLQAVGFRWAASTGTLVGGLLVALGGPWLTRQLREIMLSRRDAT
jgi:hypothetical protein